MILLKRINYILVRYIVDGYILFTFLKAVKRKKAWLCRCMRRCVGLFNAHHLRRADSQQLLRVDGKDGIGRPGGGPDHIVLQQVFIHVG